MSEIDSPACPHCGSLRVTAVRTPHLITGGAAASAPQTRDYAWQCICGAVFTDPGVRTPSVDQPAASGLPFSDQLRRIKPR